MCAPRLPEPDRSHFASPKSDLTSDPSAGASPEGIPWTRRRGSGAVRTGTAARSPSPYRGPFDPHAVERDDGPPFAVVRQFARSAGAAVVIGGIWCETGRAIASRSVFVAPSGDTVAHYDKTHLFRLSGPGFVEDEGAHTRAGDRPELYVTTVEAHHA